MDNHIKMLGNIKCKEDFLDFMQLFISTVEDSSINYYLEAVAAWAEDMDGYYKNSGEQILTGISLQLCFTQAVFMSDSAEIILQPLPYKG